MEYTIFALIKDYRNEVERNSLNQVEKGGILLNPFTTFLFQSNIKPDETPKGFLLLLSQRRLGRWYNREQLLRLFGKKKVEYLDNYVSSGITQFVHFEKYYENGLLIV